jgi:hypothetical protein
MKHLKEIRTKVYSLTDISESTKDKALAIIFDLYATGELDDITTIDTEGNSLILEFIFANGHAYTMTIKEDSRLLELLLVLEKDMQRYVY